MNDFEFTISLLRYFFGQRKIQKSLEIISETGISGWEIWLQIEFSTFLSTKHYNEIEWKREHQLPVDRRKNKNRIKMAADFVFRRKRFKRDRYIVLEFKQNNSPKTCFANMINDVKKIHCVKGSSIDMKNFWVIGIHSKSKMTKREIKDFISDKAQAANIERDKIITTVIRNTQYSFTIF